METIQFLSKIVDNFEKHARFSLERRYNFSYTLIMKTAISIPDPIFESAEKVAKNLGISRSELYTKALVRFLETYQDTTITKTLNEVYAEVDSGFEPVLAQIQAASLGQEQW